VKGGGGEVNIIRQIDTCPQIIRNRREQGWRRGGAVNAADERRLLK
jgi:hypothetical protein